MNIKWGWWSFGSLIVTLIASFLSGVFGLIPLYVVTIFSLFSLSLGIVTIIKRTTESKISLIMGIISLVLSFLLLISIIFGQIKHF